MPKTDNKKTEALVPRRGSRPAPVPARRASLAEATGKKNGSEALERRAPAEVAEVDDDRLPASTSRYSATPNFDASDLEMPKLKLAQPMTPEVVEKICQPGEFIINGQEPLVELTIVPLVAGKARIYSTDEDGILCSSGDAVHGEGNPGGNCARCPLAQFGKDRKGNSTRPACTFYYSYGVWIEEWQTVALWNLKSSAIRAAQKFNSMIMSKGMGKFAVKVTPSDPIKGPKGHYWAPIIQATAVDEAVLKSARDNNGF